MYIIAQYRYHKFINEGVTAKVDTKQPEVGIMWKEVDQKIKR